MRFLTMCALCLMLVTVTWGYGIAITEIYVIDTQESPGVLRQFREGAAPSFDGVFYRSSGKITAVAFGPDWRPFVVDARHILSSAKFGNSLQLLYTHRGQYPIRDIGFDSGGKLYFSTGSTTQGYIYELRRWRQGPLSAVAGRVFTLPIDELGGYWDGHFAFDPYNRLYVSTGRKSPGGIYQYVNGHFVDIFKHTGPISGFAFLDYSTVYFTDNSEKLYELRNFETVTIKHRDYRVSSLNDVAVVKVPDEGLCRISGKLHDRGIAIASDFIGQVYINVTGPGVKWRGTRSLQASNNDWTYQTDYLPQGLYYVRTDWKGADCGHGFCAASESPGSGINPVGADHWCPYGYYVQCNGKMKNVDFGFDGPPN